MMEEDFHRTILSNDPKFVKIALENGTNPNKRFNFQENTLLRHNVQTRGSFMTIQVIDRRVHHYSHLHPISTAIFNANNICRLYDEADKSKMRAKALEIIKVLLVKGAKVDTATCSEITVRFGQDMVKSFRYGVRPSEVIKELIQMGCAKREQNIVDINREILEIFEQHKNTGCVISKNQAQEEEPTIPVRGSTTRVWKSALQDPKFADITFVCRDGRVSAHKAILATACPYFETAFSGKWKEAVTGEWKTGKPLVIIKALLEFIYTGVADGSVINNYAFEMLELAAEYEIEPLKRICVATLGEQLSLSNCYEVLLLAYVHDLVALKIQCFELMHRNSSAVLRQPKMMRLPFD